MGVETRASTSPYNMTDTGIVWKKSRTESQHVTNFCATITANVIKDDGISQDAWLEIDGRVHGRRQQFMIPAASFQSMGWHIPNLGGAATIYAGMRERARDAIQQLSGEIPTKRVYTHLGWTKVDGEPVFLHAGGALGEHGPIPDVTVEPLEALECYDLPDPPPPSELPEAIRTSLRLLDVAPDEVTVPLYAAIWRAILGDADYTVWVVGPTGTRKTSVAALFQQHFGARMDNDHVPAGWVSTENALETLAFYAKDVVLLIDDFAPHRNRLERERQQAVAARLIRDQANSVGRMRATKTGDVLPARPPRGLLIATGEDVPEIQSIHARLLRVDVPNMTTVNLDLLTWAQHDAMSGAYARVTAAFVQYVAGSLADMQSQFNTRRTWYRGLFANPNVHPRQVENLAGACAAFEQFAMWACIGGGLEYEELEDLMTRAEEAFDGLAKSLARQTISSDPVTMYFDYLALALRRSRAYVANPKNGAPSDPAHWGWAREAATGTSDDGWRAVGDRIGWIDGDDLYLDPKVSFLVAQQTGRELGTSIPISQEMLTQYIDGRGLLRSMSETSGTHLLRKSVGGQRIYVLHLGAECLGDWLDTSSEVECDNQDTVVTVS